MSTAPGQPHHSGEPILAVEGLHRHFGGLKALGGIDLAIQPGSISSVIGPNGSGKTTLFNVITGVLPPTSGTIRFNTHVISDKPAHAIRTLGLSRAWQNPRLFGRLSVLENVVVAATFSSGQSFWSRFRRAVPPTARVQEARELLHWVGLSARFEEQANALPYGQQKLLEIARGLAANPKLILLDEPAAGLNGSEIEHLSQIITRIRQRGITVLIVEHHMPLIMGISDHITVLNYGEKLAEGTPSEIQNNPHVIEAYLGERRHANRKRA